MRGGNRIGCFYFERHGASRRFFTFHQPVASAIPLSYFSNDP